MTFGDKLKKLRKDTCMTQEQLAEKVFVTRITVKRQGKPVKKILCCNLCHSMV